MPTPADSLAMLLGMLGYRVDVARSGEAGLAAAIATRPDAILLDIGMPGMDGYEVASRLRARGDFDDVLIIAVTGFGMESDRRRSREAGIDHHLVKPCDSRPHDTPRRPRGRGDPGAQAPRLPSVLR